MQIQTVGEGAFQHIRVGLDPGDAFQAEAGTMVRMSSSVSQDVVARPKGSGGMLGALKRLVGGDSLFIATFTSSAAGGEVYLAPTLTGECRVVEVDGGASWKTTGGSFLGCTPGLTYEAKFEGATGFLSGESLFFLEVTGQGSLVVNAFGAIREIEVDGAYVVDTGHVVAFQTSLSYEISKAGSSWIQSFLSGEGLVMRFQGKGKLLVQSHDPGGFGGVLGPRLPKRRR